MTHQITGVSVAALSAAAVPASSASPVVLLARAWAGSLLPRADLPRARVYRRTRVERRLLLARGLGALARLPLRPLALLPHRGITHSACACVLASAAAGALVSVAAPDVSAVAAVGVAVGYGTHIAADACTPSGVALWAPLSRRRWWLFPSHARIPTGSLREYALAALLAALLVGAALLVSG